MINKQPIAALVDAVTAGQAGFSSPLFYTGRGRVLYNGLEQESAPSHLWRRALNEYD